MMQLPILLQAGIHLILQPLSAHAGIISDTANSVSNGLVSSFTAGGLTGFSGIAEFMRGRILLIIAPIAIFLVVRAGLRLINSQDDDKLSKAKSTIGSTCVGIMFAAISDRLVMAFYAPGGTWNRGTSSTGANILTTEILGIINWSTVFIAVLGALIIIVSGLKTVSSFGNEDTGLIKRSVSGVVTGILVITTSGAIKLAIGLVPGVSAVLPTGSNPAPAITRGVGIILTLLGFTSLIAFGIVVYAGMMMVLNWGNEDNYSKGKSLIYRALAGLAIMLLSGAAIVFLQNLVI